MKRFIPIILVVLGLFVVAVAQKLPTKPWTEWNERDVKKILDDSGWGQTQTDTDTSEMTYSPGSQTDAEGSKNQATSISYHIRFLSAKPIREALMRELQLTQKAQLTDQMKAFVEHSYDNVIVISVMYESKDQRYSAFAMDAFNTVDFNRIRPFTFLERKDGKRLGMIQYGPPGKDGLGAKYIFPRLLDGEPFITAESSDIKFYSSLPSMTSRPNPNSTGGDSDTNRVRLNTRFKVANMMLDGKLEY